MIENDETANANKTVDNIIDFRTGNESQDDNVILNAGSSASEKNSLDNIKPKNDGSAIAKKQGYFITLKSDRSVNADKTVNNVIGFKSGNGNSYNVTVFNSGSASADKTVYKIIGFKSDDGKQGNNGTLKSGRSAIANKAVDNVIGFKSDRSANGRRRYFITSKNAGSTSAKTGRKTTSFTGRSAIASSSYIVIANPSRGDIVTSKSSASNTPKTGFDNVKSSASKAANGRKDYFIMFKNCGAK